MQSSHSNGVSKIVVGLGFITMTQFGLSYPSLAQYQGNEGDIVVIGESPNEWARFRAYWQELLRLNPAPDSVEGTESDSDLAANEPDPAEIEAKLKKNLVVTKLTHSAIRGLGGSSQVLGNLKNNNDVAVTVSSVSFEIVDGKGNLIRSGAATPQPSTIAPGSSVTFSVDLLGVPRLSSNKIRLTESPFVIQGGI